MPGKLTSMSFGCRNLNVYEVDHTFEPRAHVPTLGRLPAGHCLAATELVPAGHPLSLLRRLALCFFSARHGYFRRGGDPSSTQRRDPADELHRNRIGEREMDRPLS